jgi:hypothetical protein
VNDPFFVHPLIYRLLRVNASADKRQYGAKGKKPTADVGQHIIPSTNGWGLDLNR